MLPEAILESKLPSESGVCHSDEESVFIRTVRLTLNLLTNILIVLTVFVCLLYAWSSPKLNAFQLHIVLCVLGYQFFMSQGTLVLSKYNSWSMSLSRTHRRHLHWFLQVIGIILVTAGSCVIMKEKHENFSTCHGILGLCALLTSLLSFINGFLAMHAYKMRPYIDAFWIKFIHYITGIGTLLLSAASLCLGLDQAAFKGWSGHTDAVVLMVFTCLFTSLVAMDFWVLTGRRIRNLT